MRSFTREELTKAAEYLRKIVRVLPFRELPARVQTWILTEPWSGTKFTTLVDCPRSFYYRYVLPKLLHDELSRDIYRTFKAVKPLRFIHGNLVEESLYSALRGETPVNLDEIFAYYLRLLERELIPWKVAEVINASMTEKQLLEVKGTLISRAKRSIENFLNLELENLRAYEILSINRLVKIKLPVESEGKLAFYLAADLIGYRDGELLVVDVKTGAPPDKNLVSRGLHTREPLDQVRFYAVMAAAKLHTKLSFDTIRLRVAYLEVPEASLEELLRVPQLREHYDNLLALRRDFEDMLRDTDFERRASPSCNSCPYKLLCHS